MFHNFPETVNNLVLLCEAANIAYTIPDNQTCCGLPYFEKGELKSAKTIAEYNLHIFGEADIISASLKCENTYTVKYPKIFNNTVSHNQSMRLANTAKGLNYLFEKVNLKSADKISASYFFVPDCSTEKNIQMLWLSKFKNATFQFAKLENTCCGAGFCLPSINLSEANKMTTVLIQQAIEAGTTTIIATNEICLQQLNNVIHKNNFQIKATHLIDLYASAI